MQDILHKAKRVATAARAAGALVPIDTDYAVINDCGIDFVVRIAKNLDCRKQAPASTAGASATQNNGAPFNPFLPYEQSLWVTDMGEHHAVLLNKFNVIDDHLLIVTKHYEHQDQLLTDADLAALIGLVQHHGGLGFYNGGTLAGASQHHKHLQWIPGVELHNRVCVPMETHLSLLSPGRWRVITEPFAMGLAKCDLHFDLAPQFIDFFRGITRQLGIDTGATQAARPYNLLVTSGFLWVVPRAAECFESISLNAMAFAGSLFVKNSEQLDLLKKVGPLTALRSTVGAVT